MLPSKSLLRIRPWHHRRLMSTQTPVVASPPAQPEASSSSNVNASPTASASGSSSPSQHPRANAYSDPPKQSDLPTPPQTVIPRPTPPFSNLNPPFHTHVFFAALEKCFPTPVARALMRATRAMLIDKVGGARRECLGKKDLENQAYLFKAALSELRNDTSMRIKNETAIINSSIAVLRRDIDNLGASMKEKVEKMRHENQLELDNRKHEARTELKKQALMIESVQSNAVIALGELRTEVEKTKWANMSRAIMSLAAFATMVVAFMELIRRTPERKEPPARAPDPPPSQPSVNEGLQESRYVT